MEIKGLGPKTIEKLDLSEPLEIYYLTLEYITEAVGSDKIAKKIMGEIEDSKEYWHQHHRIYYE